MCAYKQVLCNIIAIYYVYIVILQSLEILLSEYSFSNGFCTISIIYRDTVLAILSVEAGLMALKTEHNPNSLKLLIKEMPGKS